MSFIAELPTFDCMWGAPNFSDNEDLKKFLNIREYKERFKDFRPAFMGVNMNDLDKLGVAFGGFSPTLPSGDRLNSYSEESTLRLQAYFEAKKHAAELEQARVSDPFIWEDETARWTCVLLDDSEVRIDGCETDAAVVCVPTEINGMPVVAIGPDGMANLANAEEIICANSIQSIGGCAFRGCKNLKRLVLPELVSTFESSWFRHCSKVEELVLPGNMERLNASIFDNSKLKRLVVGAGTFDVEPGTFSKSKLEEIVVSDANPMLATDGKGLYSKDGSWFIALAIPVASYEVTDGCKALSKRCMSSFSALSQIELPNTISYIGEFAFYNTAIKTFVAPADLVQISEKALFRCSKLEEITLNDGLRIIQDNAFSSTSIKNLQLPGSLYHVGVSIANNTKLVFGSEENDLILAEGAEYLELDGYGVLYRNEEDGKHVIRLMDDETDRVIFDPDTRFIDEESCQKHPQLRCVILPDGLEEIRKNAFRACVRLAKANIPDSVRVIGMEAFFDTNLEAVHLPASLEELGECALTTYYSHHGEGMTSLRKIDIAPELSDRYFMYGSLLCENRPNGTVLVLHCTCTEEDVKLPKKARAIGPYAFHGARGIKYLTFSNNIRDINIRGFAIECFPRLVRIDLVEPIGGHEYFEFNFPDTPRAVKQLIMRFCMMTDVSVKDMFTAYDTVICNGQGFGKFSDGLSVYDQTSRMLARLEDPIYMSVSNMQNSVNFLRNNAVDVCEALARADDRKSIDRMIDLGYITEQNLIDCIDRVGLVQDAAMTGYLLEIRRRRFGNVSMDFSL